MAKIRNISEKSYYRFQEIRDNCVPPMTNDGLMEIILDDLEIKASMRTVEPKPLKIRLKVDPEHPEEFIVTDEPKEKPKAEPKPKKKSKKKPVSKEDKRAKLLAQLSKLEE